MSPLRSNGVRPVSVKKRIAAERVDVGGVGPAPPPRGSAPARRSRPLPTNAPVAPVRPRVASISLARLMPKSVR